MKVAMLSLDYLPNIGGIAAHVFHVSAALTRLGVPLVVVHPVAGEAFEVERREEHGVTVLKAFYPGSGNALSRLGARTRAACAGLERAAIEMGGLDVVHQHDYRVGSMPAARRVMGRAAWIWTNHTSHFLADDARLLHRRLAWLLYRRARGIITVSEEIEQATRRLWPRQEVVYVPNGVDPERFHPGVAAERRDYGVEDGDFVVLCPRRMVPKNGVLYLARAVASARRLRPELPWRFLFLGSEVAENDDYIAEVRRTLEPHSEHVVYAGNVPHGRMPEPNAIADVVVLPSLVEAVSLSALEAMATAKPVLATAVGGLPEIVHDGRTGLLVPPRDPEALAGALIRLVDDEGLRRRLGEGGFRLATEDYSWRRVAERTRDFYERVLGQKGMGSR